MLYRIAHTRHASTQQHVSKSMKRHLMEQPHEHPLQINDAINTQIIKYAIQFRALLEPPLPWAPKVALVAAQGA
jgi:hypothetical protein